MDGVRNQGEYWAAAAAEGFMTGSRIIAIARDALGTRSYSEYLVRCAARGGEPVSEKEWEEHWQDYNPWKAL